MTNEASVGAAERPSGKSAETENFPVGSFLLPAPLRPHVMAFYGFARAIDDVADAGDLEPDEKIRRLQGFGAALEGQNDDPAYDKAIRLRTSLLETDVPTRHGLDLISAFKQDAVKGRYASWDELMDYCDRSASPVGRYLLDLHGEDPAGYPASDALCNALQVINHLQDCADDYADIDRVYLPGEWMAEAGADVTMLAEPASPAPLLAVIRRCGSATRDLLEQAGALVPALKSRHLAAESGAIVQIAWRLQQRLMAEDPLAKRVKLGKAEALVCAATGALPALLRFG